MDNFFEYEQKQEKEQLKKQIKLAMEVTQELADERAKEASPNPFIRKCSPYEFHGFLHPDAPWYYGRWAAWVLFMLEVLFTSITVSIAFWIWQDSWLPVWKVYLTLFVAREIGYLCSPSCRKPQCMYLWFEILRHTVWRGKATDESSWARGKWFM